MQIRLMFIIANFKIITIAILATVPFYFFNNYLLRTIRPRASVKRLTGYFMVVLVTAVIYSLLAVLILTRATRGLF